MSNINHTINSSIPKVFTKKLALGKLAAKGLLIVISVSFSLPILAQTPSNLPNNRDRINGGFFGGNSTNASERFFEQGEYQIEQEVIELEQDPTDSEDDQILEVDPEVTDDNREIQQTESD